MQAFLDAAGALELDGTPQTQVDMDAIFFIEKTNKGHHPRDKTWMQPGPRGWR